MRKAMSKKVGAGGRFDIFLDSGKDMNNIEHCIFCELLSHIPKEHHIP